MGEIVLMVEWNRRFRVLSTTRMSWSILSLGLSAHPVREKRKVYDEYYNTRNNVVFFVSI